MKIEIGNKEMSNLTSDNLIDIALIEGVYVSLEFWNKPTTIELDNKLFSDTLVIEFSQNKKEDNTIIKTIILYFNFKDFSFNYHFKNEENNPSSITRVKLETIKYLIEQGFKLPLYKEK